MSYSTEENLRDIERSLAFAKELTELYPDARCDGGDWYSGNVSLSECDVVRLITPAQQRGRAGSPLLEVECGKRLPSGRVVWTSQGFRAFRSLSTFLDTAGGRLNESALARALLSWAATTP